MELQREDILLATGGEIDIFQKDFYTPGYWGYKGTLIPPLGAIVLEFIKMEAEKFGLVVECHQPNIFNLTS